MSYEDFKRVFKGSEDEMESRVGGDNGSSNFVTIAPKPIPELSELLNQTGPEETIRVTEDIVEKFKIKCQPIKDFTQMWNSQDTQSQAQVSLWYPSLSVSMMSSNKVRIHFRVPVFVFFFSVKRVVCFLRWAVFPSYHSLSIKILCFCVAPRCVVSALKSV